MCTSFGTKVDRAITVEINKLFKKRILNMVWLMSISKVIYHFDMISERHTTSYFRYFFLFGNKRFHKRGEKRFHKKGVKLVHIHSITNTNNKIDTPRRSCPFVI